jgi:hypothetical protein
LPVGWASPGYAQTVTTGTITGLVQDAQGGVLPGVTVTALHTPTGASYEAVTQGDGGSRCSTSAAGRISSRPPGRLPERASFELNVRLGEATDVPSRCSWRR